MNKHQKQINYLLLFSFFIAFLFPTVGVAETNNESERGKGQMEIRTERITEYREQINEVFRETELEKRFPTLFQEETVEKIEQIQEEVAYTTSELKTRVLLGEVEEDSTVDEVRNVLFTEDYVVASSSSVDEERSKSEILSNGIMIASLVAFALLLCVGIYFFIKRWNAS